ncbi:PaaI family thioesterase [Corynebacterium nasicanis]|uniref:PaaI family thioesterase n=1 Tax=Corynebacterium nasicanis TaxID=1448267 RepID=A0ABW1QCA7_9CORY
MHTLAAQLPVPFYRGVPEVTFGVDMVSTAGGQACATMTPTAAIAVAGSDVLHQGALGILIDDTSAYAALTGRSPRQWGVSSVINVDFHAPVTSSSGRFESQAGFISRTGDWGFAAGTVRDGHGALIATVDQRMRYLPGDSSVHEKPWAPLRAADTLPPLDDILQPVHREARRAEFRLQTGPHLANPLGAMHGGIGLCVSEMAARVAWNEMVADEGVSFHTSNLRTTYVRPGDLSHDLDVRVQVVHASRSFVVLEVAILNRDAMPVVIALSTLHRSDGEWVVR